VAQNFKRSIDNDYACRENVRPLRLQSGNALAIVEVHLQQPVKGKLQIGTSERIRNHLRTPSF
jgi:hypothetical protein